MSPWNRSFQPTFEMGDRRGATLHYFPETFNRYLIPVGIILENLSARQNY
jgi:hypothetical protein